MKIDELSELYRLYGYEKDYVSETEDFVVFNLAFGDLIKTDFAKLKNGKKTDRNIELKKKEYEECGYDSISVHSYHSLYEAETALFQTFFYPELNRKRLKGEYDTFCELQSRKLESEFQYIAGSFQDSTSSIKKNLVQYVVDTRKIVDTRKKAGARLTIMEAAAGYGKTCTVYEILNSLLMLKELQLPLFVELSKNRNARLFRYVLLDEINKKFPQLSLEVVTHEIKSGRIPLIIDGFDELIEQRGEILDDSDERSLTMLSTIAELLGDDSKAWILLTTRNSAIFSGDLFDEWVTAKLGTGCTVDRLRIMKPSVKEWLGDDIYEIMQEKEISIDEMANPVLLTFLKNKGVDWLSEQLKTMDSVLEQYLSLLLNRDRERLNLLLEKEEQYKILEKLAGSFVQYDITSDTSEFIQDLLQDILQDQFPVLLERYKDNEERDLFVGTKPEFVRRLSHSCLLDRVRIFENQYGFINEFVLGILAGDAVRDGYLSAADISEKYLGIIATAYEGRDENVRLELYGKLKNALGNVTSPSRLLVECALLHRPNSDYKNQYFQSFIFSEHMAFENSYSFENCVFNNCLFQNCRIHASVLQKCRFFSCQFYDIQVEGTPDEDLFFAKCKGQSPLQIETGVPVPVDADEVDNYEKVVLEQFWKPGYASAELRRTYTALFKGVSRKEHADIEAAIQSLLRKRLIRELNICYELNTEHLGEIKDILGR